MNPSNNSYTSSLKERKSRRDGLTLVELLIVLAVIIAVAGIGVSILPNIQKRTHGSTSAVSIRNAESVITSNLVAGADLGDRFDGLISTNNVIPDYVGNGNTFEAQVADADMVDALEELGITEFYPAAADDLDSFTGGNVTFNGHDYTAPTTIAPTTSLVSLTTAGVTQVEDSFNLDTTPDEIFVFGLGQESTLVGSNKAFKEAPVHYPGEGSAVNTYARYAILVGYETGGEASYIGITCIDDGENLNNIQANLGEYFEAL